ncbi:V-type ATP synthase subunit I [Candidatus Saganbacteria bacterium]|nr:V-type ATP synthase subunit I [Candidatus Saganbacteria bacterium]
MPVVPMQKVALRGHRQIKSSLLNHLSRIGILELSPLSIGAPRKAEEAELEMEQAELRSAIEFLEAASGRKKGFIESFAPDKEPVTEEFLLQSVKEFDWKGIVKSVRDIEGQLPNLVNLEARLTSEIDHLAPWQELGIKLEELNCERQVCVFPGAVKTKDRDEVKHKLLRFSSFVEFSEVSEARDKTYFLLYYLSAEEKPLTDLLLKTQVEKIVLPAAPRTPAREIEHLKKLRSEAQNEREKLLKEAQALLKYLPQLNRAYDHLSILIQLGRAEEKIADTEHAFWLTGWIPKKKLAQLKSGLAKLSPLTEVQPISPAEGETPPTLIENPPVFYPFEIITRIFGLPRQNEIDPTAPLSFFYLFFFALCLSDVGYGVILALVSYYLLKKLTLTEGGKKIILLLFWGGVATVLVGILTGGYFGLDLNTLPPAVGNPLKSLQIIDPIKNPLNVLIFSLACGVIQNLFGVSLGMYWKIKSREYVSAVLDYGLWIYFLSCLVGLLVAGALKSPAYGLLSWLSIIGAVLLVITQGRSEPTILKKAIFGLLSLYKTTGYLGDTLSYSRLLALMMTTSIIGMVVNIIAMLTKDSIPILGYVIMLLVLVIGHAFNLIVSVLGAFIHAARLQLVEFFGKFYEGGGREFRPLRRETKYILIK